MHRGFNNLDPCWQDFAASLRKGELFVKIPIGKAYTLCTAWHVVSDHIHERDDNEYRALDQMFKLIEDEALGSLEYGIKSMFYVVNVKSCQKDIEALGSFVEKDLTGVFKLFKEVLEKGLQSDPAVDWIARVGGPRAHPFEALQRDSDPVGMSPLRGTDT